MDKVEYQSAGKVQDANNTVSKSLLQNSGNKATKILWVLIENKLKKH